jgi:uncharacterized membrane protein YphA (DoxX/SURF4 family)
MNKNTRLILTIAYWITTAIIVLETGVGAEWDLARIPFVRTVMGIIGYPLYFIDITGSWKILAVIALLAPRFPRAKEWAYAGLFFNYTGAAASQWATGHWHDGVGPLIFALITLASWALRPSSRRLAPAVPGPSRGRVWYWVATGLIALCFLPGGVSYLMRVPATIQGIEHLGYPAYLLTILGVWKVLGTAALLAPRLPRLKEWAYAGTVIELTGASISHAACGDALWHVINPLVLAGIAIISWALRPASRRNPGPLL